MNGIIYCRVSSKEQIQGTSLESQEAACREYARSHDIKILATFVERGESAKFADRTQLIELLDFCRKNKGRVQVLIVWKLDRFARNVGDHFNIKASLMKYGVHVESVTEPIDERPEGKLMETILAGFAQFDNDIRATRTVQGMRRKLQEGIFPWKPPLGYQSAIARGEKKNEADRPDQPVFGLLQKAWKEFATGAYTKAEIRRLMDVWGVHTRRGISLSDQSTDNFFRNSYYAGVLVDPWSGEEFEGQHIPMVTREEFARVQQIISRRNRSVPHQKERTEFPLRGLIRCDQCRSYLTGGFSRGRSQRYPYYRCSNARCSQRKSYQTQPLHSEFASFLDQIEPKAELVDKLGELIVQVAQDRRERAQAKKTRGEADVSRIKRQIQELIQMRTEGLITNQEFLTQKQTLSDKRFAIESGPARDRLSPEKLRAELSEIKQPLTDLSNTWQALAVAHQRRFKRLLLPVGFVRGRIGTAELGLLFRLFNDLSKGKTSAVAPEGERWNQIIEEMRAFAAVFRGSEEEELAA